MLIKKQEIKYNKAQTDRYMSKQLTRIGGKVFGEYGSRSQCAQKLIDNKNL